MQQYQKSCTHYTGKIYLEEERTQLIGDGTQFTLKTLSGDVYIFQPGGNPECVAWIKVWDFRSYFHATFVKRIAPYVHSWSLRLIQAINQHMLSRALLEEAHHGYENDVSKEQVKQGSKMVADDFAT